MNPVVWQQCKEIFQNALDLEPDERIAYLNSQNLTKDAHREVTAMLAAAAADLAPWEAPALQHLSGACGISTDLQVGELVGPYRILRQIGRGGMGSVYLAERADGRYERLVALKLLRSGFGLAAGPSLLHRETSILATFDHPNIARILDAGVIGDAGVTNDTGVINNAGVIGSGLEYLVIEYVDGANLVDYCTQHDLPLRERVRLFADCCSAVQYVHQHLIIHRDIKPGNILVSPLGVPKLLDFGIAKVLSSGFADGWQADRSETFAPCFTPQYASPEQFRGEPLSVATDIYSLGVLFCEVLTGMNPRADPGKAASTNLPQLAVAVCEREPAPPSALLPPRSKLREHLRGDLDNIAIKALQKHPDSRYPSAQAFQDDLNRYLQGFPVTAKEPTWTYRASKFIRRRALPISGVALISITLLTTTILAVRQRDDAQRRFQQVRGLADSILFRLDNAIETLPGSTPARKLEVESALTYLDGLANDATKDRDLQVDRAAAYLKIGDIQCNPFEPNLGDPAGAAESYRKARRILDGISATGSDDATRKLVLAAYYQRLGDIGGHPMGGHLDTQAAIAAYRSAQELIRVSGVPASRAPGGLLADLPVHLAYELMLAEQSNEALAVLCPAIAAERTALKADPGDIGLERKLGEAYNMLAIVYMDTEPAKALSAFAMARRELTTGGDTARTPWPYARLVAESHWRSGDIYYSARRYDRAGEEYSIAVQSLEQLLQIDASNERVRDDLSRVLTRMARVVRRQEGIPQSDALRMHALEILRSSKAAASDEPPVDSATSSCPAALPAMAASPGEHRNPLLAPGNFLVTDLKAERTGALILIDARSGAQSVIASGGYFVNPHSSLIESDGNVLVADADAFGGNGGIIRLRFDPPSGGWRQEPVSCGGLFRDPVSVVLAPNSKLWVADFDGANDFHGAIIEVDPVSGAQRFLSRDQHLAQFNQIVLSPTRSILLGNYWGRDGGPAEILSIDPATGQQRVLSQFGLLEDPSGVVVAPDGSLLVSEGNVDGPSSPGALFRIDPKSGAQHVISSGGLLSNPVSLVMETPTSVVIADEGNGINAGYGTSVIRINIRTGAQQLVAMGRPMVAAGGIAITGAR